MSFFKKHRARKAANADNGLPGPSHLSKATVAIKMPKDLAPEEWRRRVVAASGRGQLQVHYFGSRNRQYPERIANQGRRPARIFAYDTLYNEAILLYDSSQHGYSAMFTEPLDPARLVGREATEVYCTPAGEDTFEIEVSAFYQLDFETEFQDEVDESGFLELMDDSRMHLNEVKRNGFDRFVIAVRDSHGKRHVIFAESVL